MIDSDRAIGANVIQLRGSSSQQALADQMRARGWSWSQATVWALETGKRPLRLLEARDLADVLDVSLDDLLKPPEEAAIERDILAAVDRVHQAHLEATVALGELEGSGQDLRQLLLDNVEHVDLWPLPEVNGALSLCVDTLLEEDALNLERMRKTRQTEIDALREGLESGKHQEEA